MTETRGFRVGFVTTLWGAIGGVVVVTAWALWPTFVEWWSVRPLIEKLKAAVVEEDDDRCSQTRDQLSELGAIAVPALLDLTKESAGDVRGHALLSLFSMRQDAIVAATRALIEALQDKDVNVRYAASIMLLKYPRIPTAAIPGMRALLLDPNEDVWIRLRAVDALANVDGLDSEAWECVRELAQSADGDIRRFAKSRLSEHEGEAAGSAGGRVPAQDD